MGKVSIVKTTNGIKAGLARALELAGGLAAFVAQADTIMLKPNLNGTEGLTNITLVESLIQLLLDSGMRNIFIAESTFGSAEMTDICFDKSGYAELAKRYDIPLINLNRSQYVETPVKAPLVVEKLKIAKEFFEADTVINIPVMKVHYATGITLALKNLKGLLVGAEKRRFHEVGLDKAIVDLNNTIKAHLHIVDCIQCMEKMGPRGGDMVDLNVIMAGGSAAEVDFIGSQIMGYSLEEVKHLKYYIERNRINLNAIEVAGEPVGAVSRPFKKVRMDDLVPENFIIHDKGACSACMNAFLLSVRFLDKIPDDAVNVYLGCKLDRKDITHGYNVAFGNCCFYGADFDVRIKGCPPYPFDLKNALKERRS